jgi:hypothetical protein
VTTIDAEGIKNIPLVFGERDILKVAIAIPGIKTAGEGSAGFNVRGGKEDQNLILLDNALLYNPAHFFGFFSALNPYTTKKVDIYKGSIPPNSAGVCHLFLTSPPKMPVSTSSTAKVASGDKQHRAGNPGR